jgi:hypothetical protein
MRNITFDESSVLTEFLKIAKNKNLLGLEKEAQQPRELPPPTAPTPKPAPEIPATVPGTLPQKKEEVGKMLSQLEIGRELKPYPAIAKLYSGQRLSRNEAVRFLKELQVGAMVNLSQRLPGDLYNKLRAQVLGVAKSVLKPAHLPRLLNLVPAHWKQTPTGEGDGKVSEAADKDSKVYDVTGETGKDLIDSAHPGGTRTELTHSKTEENLVETIFEQQEKDIQVATSIPTGVYAALTDLADGLDKLGYREQADMVDEIIQKTAQGLAEENDRLARQFVDLVEDKLSYFNKYRGQLKRWADKYPRLNMKWVENRIRQMAKTDRGLAEAFEGALNETAEARYGLAEAAPAIKEAPPALEPIPTGQKATLGPARVVQVDRPVSQRQQRVLNWQKYYNAAIRGTGLPPIAVDGKKGPETWAAMKRVRESGAKTLSEFAEKYKAKTRTEFEEIYEKGRPAVPLPPAPPKIDPDIWRRQLWKDLQPEYRRDAVLKFNDLIGEGNSPKGAYDWVIKNMPRGKMP